MFVAKGQKEEALKQTEASKHLPQSEKKQKKTNVEFPARRQVKHIPGNDARHVDSMIWGEGERQGGLCLILGKPGSGWSHQDTGGGSRQVRKGKDRAERGQKKDNSGTKRK